MAEEGCDEPGAVAPGAGAGEWGSVRNECGQLVVPERLAGSVDMDIEKAG